MPDIIRQASAIPYRRRAGRLEFCLITSMSGKHWGFPKGIIDPGNSPTETALLEAAEEAGLSGQIVGEPVGAYHYHKWGTELVVAVFLMEVSQTDDSWLEADQRQREWLDADHAVDRLDRLELQTMLHNALRQLNGRAPKDEKTGSA